MSVSKRGDMAVHFERAERLFQRRWYAAALWEWQQHLPTARRNPAELARTFNAMSATLMKQGEERQAFIKAELARDAASQLPSDHPQAFYANLNGALAAARSGDLEIARGLTERALILSDSHEVPDLRRTQVMGLFAYIAIHSEQYDVARTWLARLDDLPAPSNEWNVRFAITLDSAICLGAAGEHDRAEAAFAEALDFAAVGDHTNIYSERGWMRLRDGDVGGAVADAREVLDQLVALPAYLTMHDAADGLLLVSALARAHGDDRLSSRLYMQGFAWLATAGWRADLRRSTRALSLTPRLPRPGTTLPDWTALVRLTEALTSGDHRGPAPAQRLGRCVHGVASQFAPHADHGVLGTAAVLLRMPASLRNVALLPAQSLVRRVERRRDHYDAAVIWLLDSYDRALVEEGQPYPAVLERMTREAGTSWDPRAVHRILLAHAS